MSFHSINWLYAGVAVLAITLLVYARGESVRRKLLARFASAKLLPELSRTVSPAKVFVKKTLFALGLFAVFVALARPQWGYRWEETKSRGIDVIFAIDTSKSMLAEDVKPNRLDRAKLSVLDLLESIGGDRIGIVAFSGQAFLQCPLTLDYDAFRMSLEALDTNVIQRGGTNIAAAIAEAASAFARTSNHKVIVLISDGEELESSAVERAKKAASDGVVIYTLGVGGTRGEAITIRDSSGRPVQLRDEDGKIVTSKLNEKVLSEVAKATGGFYEPLTANGMDAIYENGLKKIPQQELSARMKQLAIERFQIPLAIAMVLLALESLVGTRRFFTGGKTAHTAVLTLFLLPAFFATPQDVSAREANASDNAPAAVAETAQPASENSEAEKNAASENSALAENPTARGVFNNAVDLYKKGDLAESKEAFIRAMKMSPDDFDLHAKAFYNIGNIDYRQAKYSLASAESAAESGAKAAQLDRAFADTAVAGNVLLQQGAPLLEKELAAIAAAKTDAEKKAAMEKSPLKDKQFQQQLKQGISQCEAVEKQTSELAKAADKNLSQWKSAGEMLGQSADDYKSALALAGEFANASKNLESVKTAQKNVAEEFSKAEKLRTLLSSEETKQKLAAIAKLKEDLKKLVRDDNNQQNQNQQQNQQNRQNQQDNKQDNQNQNQQNQQNNQNQQNQNQNQQQDKQNRQDNSKKSGNTQDKQNQQNRQPKDGDDDGQNQPDKQDKSKPNSDKNGGKDNRDKAQNADANRDKPEPNRDEQAVDNRRQSDAEKKSKPENAEKQGGADGKKELPAKSEKAQTASASEEKAAENERENFRASAGAMTKGEAKQLLESMKDSDKILPLRGFGEQKDRFEKSYKDW